ncbi:MAG: hypothetical protein ACXAES_09765 [Promethearchaeota archaeon]|jgi:hypothetical protein
MPDYGKVLLDCSKNWGWINFKKDQIKKCTFYGLFGMVSVLLLLVYFNFFTSASYSDKVVFSFIMTLGFFVCLFLFSFRFGYDDGLILYEKGMVLPTKKFIQIFKGKKNYVPYRNIYRVNLTAGQETLIDFISIDFTNSIFDQFWKKGREIDTSDIKKFKEILINNNVTVID